jgi:glucose/arabinose dehydrogenase
MVNRLRILGFVALGAVAGCSGGNGNGDDAGPGNDGGPGIDGGPGADAGPGTDTGVVVDTGTPLDMGGMVDAFSGPDAGSGCELTSYPPLTLSMLARISDLPTSISTAPGRTDLFVVGRGGRVFIVDATSGTVGTTPFLDVSSRLGGTPSRSDEWGLLGLAFHPDYATNGLAYIAYTAEVGPGPAPDCNGVDPSAGPAFEDRVAVIQRSASSPDQATFMADIFTIPDPRWNHNGGQLGFGPDDGLLYYAVGDGGEQGDPCDRARDVNVDLGKIHRFHVGPGIATYEVPATNPFASGGGHGTIWAYGLRNAWRFSWDRRTHDMYIGDVGQNEWEEIDFLAAGTGAGTDFGWSTCEGTHDFNGSCASLTSDTLPILEYSHHDGTLMRTTGNASVTGGYVYRGSMIPGLNGAYLFADEVSSVVAAIRNCPGTPVTATRLDDITGICQNPTTFGEDTNGELLIACASGRIFRILPM